MDCFFVAVERLFRPELIGQPVIVGADPAGGRGVVCTASYEARRFGVHSAMPITQAARLCPQGIFVRPRGGCYSTYAARVRERLEALAPEVVQRSIDEFECDLSGCELLYRGDLAGACHRAQQRILDELGLGCSWGLASNGLVAKVAAGLRKPMGAVLVPQGEEADFLAPLAVERLPGVGPTVGPWLGRLGVRTIGDLARLGPHYLELTLGRIGSDLYAKAIGRGGQVTALAPQKSISREVTFATDTEDPVKLRRTLSGLCEDACRQLRELRMRASQVSLKLRYADFKTLLRQETVEPTDLDTEVFPVLQRLWKRHDTRRVRVRLIGLKLGQLHPAGPVQGRLFDDFGPRDRAILRALDRLIARHGDGLVRFGRSLEGRKARRAAERAV